MIQGSHLALVHFQRLYIMYKESESLCKSNPEIAELSDRCGAAHGKVPRFGQPSRPWLTTCRKSRHDSLYLCLTRGSSWSATDGASSYVLRPTPNFTRSAGPPLRLFLPRGRRFLTSPQGGAGHVRARASHIHLRPPTTAST